MTKLIATYEILGAMSHLVSDSDRQDIIDNLDAKVSAVSNTATEVHLALPYYSGVDKISFYEVSDTDASIASGGEIVVAIAVAVAAVGGAAAAIGVGVDAAQKKGK